MCYYYSLNKIADRYLEKDPREEVLNEGMLVNGFKHPKMPVVTDLKLKNMHWGLIPFWAKDDQIKKYTLNARSETLFEKPSFKNRIRSHRCIIPATGFFEWQHTGNRKQPWFIRLKNQECFSFAGIWDEWSDRESGETFQTFSIITTPANPLLAEIHNSKKRMPAILTSDIEFEWPQKNLSAKEINEFLVPLKQEHFEAWPVAPFDPSRVTEENITLPMLS